MIGCVATSGMHNIISFCTVPISTEEKITFYFQTREAVNTLI